VDRKGHNRSPPNRRRRRRRTTRSRPLSSWMQTSTSTRAQRRWPSTRRTPGMWRCGRSAR
jgi:hypothetical protein